jgi:uncharacterized membrane-anchored protein YhcB (DUF1043 family)
MMVLDVLIFVIPAMTLATLYGVGVGVNRILNHGVLKEQKELSETIETLQKKLNEYKQREAKDDHTKR